MYQLASFPSLIQQNHQYIYRSFQIIEDANKRLLYSQLTSNCEIQLIDRVSRFKLFILYYTYTYIITTHSFDSKPINQMDQLNEVVKYVLYRCRQNNTPLTQVMANFIVQTIYNPKTQRFYLEDKLSESELRQLKQTAIRKIFSKQSLQMKIINMQVTYDTEFLQTELSKQSQAQNKAIQSGEHIDEVVNYEVKNPKDFEGLTQLYKKIFNFLIYKNKEITDKQVYEENKFKIEKEVAAALESVIPRAALGPFVTLNSSEKVTQLVQLANLVIGIRLFNQEISKGGAGLIKTADLLNIQSKYIRDKAFAQLEEISNQCEKYTIIFKAEIKKRVSLQTTEFKRLKNQLTFLRQYRSFLINLEEEIESSQSILETNEMKFQKQINELKILLGTKTSAPKQQVYPRFAILAQAYISIYDERRATEQKIRLYQILKQYRKSFPLSLSQKLFQKVSSEIKVSQNDQQAHQVEQDPNSGIEIILPSTSPDFMQKTCDYLGFCIWCLVNKNGLLIPGEPDLGVYKYKQKNCVFCCIQAINDFIKDPEFYIHGVIEQCRKNPQLIHFLRMEESFKNVKLSLIQQAVEGGIKNKLMLDKGVDTPVHFIEKNIDPNYCWNEWELRKKAIQMANIRKTQTRSDQTILSNFRVDSDTQTYLKKDAQTNTVKNTGTQFKAEKESIGV